MEQQSPLIAIGAINFNLSLPTPDLAQETIADFAAALAAQPAGTKLTPPAIGEYWPGQGGIYGGLRLYPEGLCHLIFAAQDVGKHAYGEYGTEVEAANQIDGRANTAILVNRDGSHPAADAAYTFTCDGHNDFYLPAIGELHHSYLYLPDSFEKAWYVSSSQRSAHNAYFVDFEGGWLYDSHKSNEFLVRPVRRILQ
ncbi:DUF1566 domain-containing protein [Pseudomonas putida]|uniref:DUF1566 domain-containing protein n=1 Tax=Pseudomonas putida TaxID=303 RepID=A0A1B2F1B5_PSEPU|nr:DUF1566 domain-containing protein [Pseudomonas putida]ANY85953.1 hypothetical protein IEC33019_0349 [Pseudomonas putida]